MAAYLWSAAISILVTLPQLFFTAFSVGVGHVEAPCACCHARARPNISALLSHHMHHTHHPYKWMAYNYSGVHCRYN